MQNMKMLNNLDYIAELCNNGAEVYIIGGAVRNLLFNKFHNTNVEIKDYDYLVRLIENDKLCDILKKFGSVSKVGTHFGITIFKPFNSNKTFEFALPRTEESTGYKYRQFAVTYDSNLSIIDDFCRRDATINAMGIRIYNLEELTIFTQFEHLNIDKLLEKIIDPFDGINDIKNKIWKCVGNPRERFVEDPTRMIRAFRQSSQLNLSIEDLTYDSIVENSDLLKNLIPQSYVRLFNEFFGILKSEHSKKYLKIMNELKILDLLGMSNVNIDFTNNIELLIKFAIFINIESMDTSIKTWCNIRQIAATVYLNPNDVEILDSIQFICKEPVNFVDYNLYDMLKLREKIHKMYKKNSVIILSNVLKYFLHTNKITIELFEYLVSLLKSTQTYPIISSELKLNGNLIKKYWNLEGMEINELKEYLLDCVFKNECLNTEENLIMHAKNFITTMKEIKQINL